MSSAPWLQLDGDYFDGSGSSRTSVRIALYPDGRVEIIAQAEERVLARLDQNEITVSDRLANSPRYLDLPEGQRIETLENETVDQWLSRFRPGLTQGLIHRLEANWRFVALTLVLVVVSVWGTVNYGVPYLSQQLAKALPQSLLDQTSEQTLALFDQYWLEPSQLDDRRQQQLRQHFEPALTEYADLGLRVIFRHSEAIGANAFALPDGTIIFTDGLVRLAEHDDELTAILAHEIGHVAHRHGLRRIIQNSMFLFVLALITGDASGTADLVLGLPILFAELAYSREHERESDRFALDYLQRHQIPPRRFADLMNRLAQQSGRDEEEQGVQRYLQTHPQTSERVKAFQ
ncbi:M48 family metallopeptidase [Motiliproteus sp.]|uniref:M48 family metallopeptidase n=1 Tax=Motiliproteus sp. TaxID=1898955 RepID=UPI003BA8C719